jgi:hypothetical protein
MQGCRFARLIGYDGGMNRKERIEFWRMRYGMMFVAIFMIVYRVADGRMFRPFDSWQNFEIFAVVIIASGLAARWYVDWRIDRLRRQRDSQN